METFIISCTNVDTDSKKRIGHILLENNGWCESESFHRLCLQNSDAAGDRLILTFEILTDKFEEATFFSGRYIAFLWEKSSII